GALPDDQAREPPVLRGRRRPEALARGVLRHRRRRAHADRVGGGIGAAAAPGLREGSERQQKEQDRAESGHDGRRAYSNRRLEGFDPVGSAAARGYRPDPMTNLLALLGLSLVGLAPQAPVVAARDESGEGRTF